MECYEQYRSDSIIRALLIYNSGWRVQADEEDGTAEVDLPFSKAETPTFVGFFVCGMMGADYVTLVINMTNAHTTITI